MNSGDQPLPRPKIDQPQIEGDRLVAVAKLLEQDRSELVELEDELERSFKSYEASAIDPAEASDAELTFGERLADKVAAFGGSWTFLILFGVILAVWIGINATIVALRFDPYPFILLNLVLSCIAAVQAPVIMMSQNRQEAKDRLRAQHDYRVNLKAELEVRELHDKMDHLLYRQMQRMLELQRLQVELLSELSQNSPPRTGN